MAKLLGCFQVGGIRTAGSYRGFGGAVRMFADKSSGSYRIETAVTNKGLQVFQGVLEGTVAIDYDQYGRTVVYGLHFGKAFLGYRGHIASIDWYNKYIGYYTFIQVFIHTMLDGFGYLFSAASRREIYTY